MSALSEALERHLRTIMPLPTPAPAPKATVAVTNVPSVKTVRLGYQKGSSDKVYYVQIVEVYNGTRGWVVNFQYGRRTGTLITGTKTASPVSLLEAREIFYDLVNEKKAKGYKEI